MNSFLDIYLLSEQTRWMPQKKAKKIKLEKSKKPSSKSTKGGKIAVLGAAAKHPSKVAGPGAKALNGTTAKKAHPAKQEKPVKKLITQSGIKKLPLMAKEKKLEAPSSPALSPGKGAKEPRKPDARLHLAGKAESKGKGKRDTEVVVVVPAPKGVTILTKEGKKKGKASAEGIAAKKSRCREPGCDHEASLLGYCRMHYIKNWRRIKRKESILASGQLNNYVEELVNKYPDKYLDVIRQDLATEKEWSKVVLDLELEGTDEDAASEDEMDSAAEGVRPATSGGAGRGEFDDEGESF